MKNKITSLFVKTNSVLNRSNNFEKNSYSQSGEDIIISFVFDLLGINKPSYLDLGAHHPFYLSNTYLFYKTGCKGVNVEPDPFLIKEFVKSRDKDINLNIGIGLNEDNDVADFYVMTARTLNTFSQEEANKVQSYGTHKIEEIIKVKLKSVNTVIKEEFNSVSPNFVSIDVEGLDFEILKSLDLKKYRPEVFCIETLSYTEDNTEKKLQEIINYMIENDYFVYADTYINTVFVDRNSWVKRPV